MAPMKLHTWNEKPKNTPTHPPKQIIYGFFQPTSSKSSKVQEFFSIKFSAENLLHSPKPEDSFLKQKRWSSTMCIWVKKESIC
jgi:hypothetical protein